MTHRQTAPSASATKRSAARRRAAQRRQPRLSRLLVWLLSAVLGNAGLAYAQVPAGALPTGGKVMVGAGQLQQSSNLLIVNQGSHRLGMDWQSFNIGSGASVEFRQPGADSIALNRVVGNSGSEIYGKLRANGQVFLTNPNGVLFAPGSQVDVGGLVASTLDLSQQDFANGRFIFSGGGNAAVINQGALRANAGGYLALFGKHVDNQGEIAVDTGTVVLASGRAATVSISGSGLISAVVTPGDAGAVSNSGSISADGGVVRMSAASAEGIAASLVNNSGLVRANTLVERAGEIWITGDNVASSGQIQAAAPDGGDGGRVMLIGDMQRGTAQFSGSVDASAASGTGGFVETSAASINVAGSARVSTAAPNGKAGTWLIDPTNFAVVAGGGSQTTSSIGADTLSTNLGGGNVTIATAAAANGADLGDISVNAAVSWSANRLTLNAHNNIGVNAALTGTGTATLAFEYGQAALAAGNTSTYSVGAPVTLPAGGSFSTKLGSNGTTNVFTVVVDAAGLQGIDSLSRTGNYAVGVNIDLSSIPNFNPIGNETTSAVSAANSFSGRFDGLGHTVSGLTTSGYASTGLFATTTGADIRNLTLNGGSVAGTGYAGAVAGLASGATNLTQVRSTVVVTSSSVSQAVGGLIGQSGTGTITNSSVGSVGNPVAISGGNYTGGLVGNASTTTITNSSAAATLTGTAVYMGGLAGQAAGAVSGSSATGTAQTTGSAWLGGLIGDTTGTVTNSTADVAVTATNAGSYVGGLLGASTAGVSGSSAAGAVDGGARAGGLVGSYASSASIQNSSASGNVSSSVASTRVGGLVGAASGAGSVTGSSATGNVSGGTNSAMAGGLVGDFQMSGGIINSSAGAAAGANPATTVSGGTYAGGVVGWYNSSIALVTDASNTIAFRGSSVTGSTWAGGIAGYVNSATSLSGLTSTANVTTTGPSGGAGGLAGRSNGSVAGSSASGNVTGADDAGGLIAYAQGTGTLSNSSASGSVTSTATTGTAYAGGLVGRYALSGAITGTVTATGVVSGGSSAGGFVGYWNSAAAISGLSRGSASVTGRDYIGGVVGYSEAASVSGLSSAANVTATGTGVGAAGGVVGRTTGSIATSSASGNVSGLYTVGGLVGLAEGTGTLTDSSASGSVSGVLGSAWIGGLVGQYALSGSISGTISATGVVSGGSSAGGVVGYYSSTAPISGLTRGTASVTGQDWVGGLIGYSAASSITGSSSAANVTSTGISYAAGGLVGRTGGSITNSTATGNVSAAGDAGGLIGRAEGTGALTDVSATGSVTSTGPSALVGGLAGYVTSGAVLRGTASGAVSGGSTTGGLIGNYNDPGGIQNSSTAVTSTVSGLGQAGGLVGSANGSGGYTDVTARGNVTGGNHVGGLIGNMSSAGAVTNALAIGNVTASGSYAGGLIGAWQSSGSITDSRATGNVVNNSASGYAGGLVGYGFTGSNAITITNSSAAGNVSGGSYLGGLAGWLYDTQVVRGTATGSVNTSSDNTVYAGGLIGSFTGYFYSTAQVSNSSATGAVFVDAPYSYAGGLVGTFSNGSINASTASGSVTVKDSLNANNTSNQIGGLVGSFSGTGISDSAASGTVNSGYYAGGLVGNYQGSLPLTNSSATGNVTGTQYVGGLVGYHQNAGITNGFASGQVSSTSTGAYTGGLVGFAYLYAAGNLAGINDSRATGNVSGGTTVGGLIGYMQDYNSTAGTVSGITNSHASGNVSGGSDVGGLIGNFYGAYATVTGGISNSSASGNVEANQRAGGLVGYHNSYGGVRDSFATGNVLGLANSSDKSLGGLVGEFQTSNTTAGAGVLTRSYATGTVSLASSLALTSITDVYAGGLVGTLRGSSTSATALTDSYATGAVTIAAGSLGNLRAGGLVGNAIGAIERTYSTGAVSATGGSVRTMGGLVALRNATSAVTSSYWATDTSGQASSFGGTASTLTALKDDATFAGWDLATTAGTTQVWRIYDGLSTPLLRGFLTPLSVTLADITKVYDGTSSLGSGAIIVGGTGVANPERILASGVAANVGSYGLGTANVYSVQNGYDLTVAGTATLTINPKTLTFSGLAANKVYDGTTTASFAANPQFGGLVAGEDLIFQPGNGFAMQFASKAAGTAKTVNLSGSYALANGTRGLAANYVLPGASATTADITPATLTAGSFSATNRVYDGTTTVAVSATSSTLTGVIAGDSVGVDLSSVTGGTVTNKNAGIAKPVTVAGVVLSGADAGNYTLAGVNSVSVDITPKLITINGINATDRQYNRGTNVGLSTGSVSLAGVVGGDLVEARLNNLTGNVADKNVGNGKPVTVTGLGLRGLDAGNYSAQAGAVSVNINPYLLTLYIAHTSSSTRVYDGTTNAATYFPTYWYGGDDLVPTATSIGYADKNVAYNGSGAVISKVITASGISISGVDAANYALQNTSTTLDGTITPKPLSVSGVAAVNRAYDGTRDVAVTISGATVDTTAVVAGDVVNVATPGTGTVTGQVVNKNVGTAKAVTVPGLALTGADAGNYSITSGTGGGVTVNITRKDLTAVYTAVDRAYDGNVYATMNVTSADIVSGDAVNFYIDQTYCGVNACGYARFTEAGRQANGSYVDSRHVGTAKPVVIIYNQLVDTDANNYTLLNPTGPATGAATTANITPKPVNLAFTGVSKVYDGSTDASVTLNIGGSGLYSVDAMTSTQTAVYTGATAKNVGTGKPISVSGISLLGANASNYTVGNTTATTTGPVTAKPITVSGITATDRAYDGTTAVAVTAGTVTSTGFVAGDTVAITLPPGGLSAGTIANKNVGTNKPVTVTGLTLTGGDAGNYSIDTVGSGITVNITQQGLTPTYTGVSRVYNGGITASVTSTTTGIAAGDTVTFSQQAVYTGTNARDAGTGKAISVTNISLGGSGAANYTLASTTATTTGDITPKSVNVTYTGASRVYNGVADVSAAVVGSSLQFVAGDTVGLAQSAIFTGDGSAGDNKPVSISSITLTGAQATNYSLLANTGSTTASITPRSLGVTGITATNRVYDGTTTVAVNVAGASVDTSTVIAGDVVSVTLPGSGISTGTLADRNVGNNRPVAITGLAIVGSSAANYSLVGAAGLTVNITPKALTAVYSGVNKVYDGTADALVTGNSGDIFGVDALSLGFSAQGVFTAGKNVGTGKTVDVISAFLTGTSRDNYTLANPTGTTTADITPRALTANYSGGSKVYDGTALAVVTGTLANRVTGDTVSATQTAEFTGAVARNVGNNKPISVTGITLAGADAGNYTLANTTDTTTGSITPKPITVSGLTNVLASDRVYNGTRVVDVTVPVGVTLVPNSSDIIVGDTVTIDVPGSGVTTGTVVTKNAGNGKAVAVDGLTLSGTDAGNYSIAGTAGITVNITPKSLTAVYSGVNKVYDGSTAINATGASADIIAGDSLVISGSGTLTGVGAKNAGTAKAVDVTAGSLSSTDAGNYSLTNTTGSTTADVTQRSVTPTYLGGSRVYDGSTGAPVTSNTGNFVAGDSIGLTETAVFTGAGARNAGTGKAVQISGISLTGSDAANYSLATNNASTTGTITPKALTLTGLIGVTAASRIYDGTRNVSVTITSTGTIDVNPADLVAGDTVSVVAPGSGLTTGTLVDKNAGTNKPLVVDGLALTGADAANYSVSATNGITVNIAAKSLTATYTGVNRAYDGTALASVVGSSAELVAGDSLSINGSGIFSAGKNAGTGKTIAVTAGSLGGTDAANYSLLNTTGSTTANITPKAVTVAYVGGTRVYDGTTAAPVTGTVTGLIAGDAVTLAQGAVFTGVGAKNVGTGKAVDVSGVTLAGADAPNYSLTANLGTTTAAVTPRPLGIIGLTGVAATDRVYNGSTTVDVTVSTSGTVTPNPADLIAGDVVTITAPPTGVTTGTMANKNVGSNKPVAVAGLTLGGADAGNYSVASTSGVTVNITPKLLTATYAGVNRTYDGTTAASAIGSSADIVAGDSVLINAAGVFSGIGARNAGLAKPFDLTSATLTSTDAANYTLVNATGTATADVAQRQVIANYAAGTRVYDGTTTAPVSRNLSGFLAGDAVSLTETAVFTGADAKNVGTGKAVQISAIALSGADAINYALVTSGTTTTGSITPRPLNVTGLSGITAVDRTYDGTRAVQVNVAGVLGTASGDLIAGDNVTVNVPGTGLNGGTMADKNAGQNKAVVLSGLFLSGTDAPNYAIAGTAGLYVNIAPRTLSASYSGVSREYDGTTAATVQATSSGIVAGDGVVISASALFTGTGAKNVGTAKPVAVQSATLSGADAANYLLDSTTATTSADITPRTVTATYASGSRVYDGTTVGAVTRTTTGFIDGDAVGVSETAVFTGAGARNVGVGKLVEVSGITLTGTDAGNYALVSSSTSTTGTITPRPLNVTGLSGITAVDREYDGTRNVQVNVPGNLGNAGGDVIAGDDVTVNVPGSGLGGGTIVDKSAGLNRPVALNGLFLSGADASNYAITGTAGVSVNIAPRSVSLLGVSAVDRVYDGTTTVAISTSGGSISGVLAGDDVQLTTTGVTGSMADKHVGLAKAVSVNSLSLGGADVANYTVAGGGGLSVNIARRTLTPSFTVASKNYDGSTAAIVTLSDDHVAGDALSLSAASATFADRNAGTGITVTVSNLAASGADAANYQLSTTSLSALADINRAPLTVAANSLTKVYGETLNLNGSEFSANGLASGETLGQIALSSNGSAATAEVVNSPYAINAGAISGGTFNPLNYVLALSGGQMLVTPRPLTIATQSQVRFVGDTNNLSFDFDTSVGGLVNGATLNKAAITQSLPAGIVTAAGGSVFQLTPAGGALFGGDLRNYSVSYASGLLVVLPQPPRVGDSDAGSADSGNVNFAIGSFSAEEISAARSGLERAIAANTAQGSTLPAAGAPALVPAAPADIGILLGGDGRRITLPDLLRLPLISFDPQLRRLLSAADPATNR